jgi:16S rRNA (adenine1518-N6/adenine1519-N6)-dimethyltransferase
MRRPFSTSHAQPEADKNELPFFVPKKRMGQNFLVDPKALIRIVDACELSPSETILEIGSGAGALTRHLAPQVSHIIAVEADGQLAEGLKSEFDPAKLTVHHADFLKFDLSQLPPSIKVIGNLPYYISTPIITRVIDNRSRFSALFMTVQLEFGERLIARPGSKNYGSLSVFVQFYAEPHLLFKIGNKSFRPVPKVNSCFMRIAMRGKPVAEVVDEKLFDQVVRKSFLQRRKSLLNSLSSLRPKDVLLKALEKADIAPQRRAEELTPADFARLTNALVTRN